MQKTEIFFGKKILLGITGSVAATKSLDLAEALQAFGAEIKLVCTKSGLAFCDRDRVEQLNLHVFTDIFADDIEQMDHITLAKWADLFLIAPASASILSRCATGLADQLLSLIYLATDAMVMFAPAMNQQMWSQAPVQDNLASLKTSGNIILGPGHGEQACGDIGFGRMLEPEEIADYLQDYFSQPANNLNVLITAGPTQEAIDPVRYLSNRSSGKMGYALAESFTRNGADVTLVSGPTNMPTVTVKRHLDVVSAAEMLQAVLENIEGQDIVVMAAAVADYRVAEIASDKLKKDNDEITLNLVKTPDILQNIRQWDGTIFLVGFALETEDLLAYAGKKLQKKQLNMIVANQYDDNNRVFSSDNNKVTVLTKTGDVIEFPKQDKKQLANALVDIICKQYKAGI